MNIKEFIDANRFVYMDFRIQERTAYNSRDYGEVTFTIDSEISPVTSLLHAN